MSKDSGGSDRVRVEPIDGRHAEDFARMSGDVIHQDVKIESGAFIDGHLKPEFGKSGAKNIAPQIKPVASVHTPAPPVAKPAEIRPAGTA